MPDHSTFALARSPPLLYTVRVKSLSSLILLLLSVLLCHCTSLQSESGLYDVRLERNVKLDVQGSWLTDTPCAETRQEQGSLYLAPLDIQLVYGEEPELSTILQQKMGEYMQEGVASALQEMQSTWTIAPDAENATLRIDLAIVRFRPQKPFLNLAGHITSHFVPVPFIGNATNAIAGGDIVLEGTIREVKTGKLLFAFKDSNRKKGKLFNGTMFTKLGPAEASLKSWVYSMSQLIMAGKYAAETGTTVKELIKEEGYGHALLRQLRD